jgi:4-hydroxy-tetrahydrodipicolinate synthase
MSMSNVTRVRFAEALPRLEDLRQSEVLRVFATIGFGGVDVLLKRRPLAWATMATQPLGGVIPVISTPFKTEGSIDIDALEEELRWVLDQGVDGLATGMVSEILRLDEAERRALGRVVTSVARDRGALSILSCGAETTRQAISYATQAAAMGADAIMVIPPTTVALDEAATFDYFVAIARACELAIVVQDASAYVGRPLSIAIQVRLSDALGDQVYFKPEAQPLGQRLSQLRDATRGAARTFEGTAGVNLTDAFQRGVIGSMPGAEVCWAVAAMWRALTSGDLERATRLTALLALLVNFQTSLDSYVAIEKHLLWRQGVLPATIVRGPVGYELDEETGREVDRLLVLLQRVNLDGV